MEIYKKEYVYTTKDGRDIEYRILSKRELENITSKYFKENSPNNLYKLHIVETALLISSNLDTLSDEDIENLYNLIIEKSTITKKIIDKIEFSFWVLNDEMFKSDTWKCEVCKEMELQKDRNCPFIKERNNTFMLPFRGKIYRECPIGLIDNDLISKAFLAYRTFDKGILPEKGALIDQTIFFIEVSNLMQSLVNQLEKEEMEKTKKEN